MTASSLATLRNAFNEPFCALGHDLERDRDVVVASWPSVPLEIIRAAGLTPVFARGAPVATPAADAVLEARVFPNRIRQLVEAALTGRLAHIAAIVLPRTADADYKAYLYLQELRRRGPLQSLPPVLLFDLLQTQSPEVAAYNKARSAELLAQLAAISGRRCTTQDLLEHIERGSAARCAARRLSALRRGVARVSGAEVLPLLGARWQMPPERYAALAEDAADALADRVPLTSPRVLLAGVPVDSPAMHASIETLHATVVDEVSPFGNDGAAWCADIATDPLTALANCYATCSITARARPAMLERRIEESLDGIDVAVILLPHDDARFGWDYPRLRAMLDRRSIPHVVLEVDPETPLTEPDLQRIRAALATTPPLQAACHG